MGDERAGRHGGIRLAEQLRGERGSNADGAGRGSLEVGGGWGDVE